jgi:hypothetical protein
LGVAAGIRRQPRHRSKHAFFGIGPQEPQDHLPLELGHVHRVRQVSAVDVGQHVLELGGVVGAELGEDECAALRERALRGSVGRLVTPGVEPEALIHHRPWGL